MKIGITCYPTYGGSGVVATELGMELAARGHEIHFICYSRPYRLPDFMQNVFYHEVNVSKYPLFEYPPYSLALSSQMVDTVLENKLDILHVHYAVPHATSAFLAKEMLQGKIPVITTLHGTDITIVGNDPSFFRITQFSMEKSDALTTVSNYLKTITLETFTINKEIQVIYNFIKPPEPLKGKCNRLYFAKADEKILVHVSNFRPVKRIQDVIKTSAEIAKSAQVKLLMIGDGPERSMAEQLARDLNISDKVIFLGKQLNIASLLQLADLMLFPSENESFGLAALEAMSYGVPVIATNSGGTKEVVQDSKSGYLLKVGDIDGMAEKALILLHNPDLRQQMSLEAKRFSMDNFHSDKIIPQYEALYKSLL